jgi:uncharacterized protein YndB with AHSA1/START domain
MTDGDERIVPPDLVYIIFIRSTPQKVWDALTRSEFTKQFFFRRTAESDWRQGSRWRLVMEDGRTDVEGEVLEAEPPRRLKVSWRVDWLEEGRALEPAIVTYDIEPAGDAVKLTLTQHNPGPVPRKFVDAGKQGWATILSSLKSLLETGQPLIVKLNPPEEV